MCWLEKKILEVAGKSGHMCWLEVKYLKVAGGVNKLLLNKVVLGGLIYDSFDRLSPPPPTEAPI